MASRAGLAEALLLAMEDEPGRHIFCSACQQTGRPIVKWSLCGKRAPSGGRTAFTPAGDGQCQDCQDLFYEPCAMCGA